jgi:glycerol uptake facilitator-like aquaporin
MRSNVCPWLRLLTSDAGGARLHDVRQVFILEFISTLILGLVTFATVVDRERNMADNAAPLAVGLAYTIGMFAEGPYTGGNVCGAIVRACELATHKEWRNAVAPP